MAEASALECSINDQKGVVLRVKRKRTDDPVEALVVSHVIPSKRVHVSSEDKKQDDKNVSSEIFRLLGTCNEGDDTRSNDLLKNFSKTKVISHEGLKQTSKEKKDQTQKKQKQRQANKELQSEARFRVISNFRQDDNDCNSVEQVSSGLQRTVSSDGSTDSADDEVKRLFTVYDVIRDEIDEESSKKKASKSRETEDTNTILCNSVKMIREKLVVSEEEKSALDLLDKKYVYDYYYAMSSDKQLGDILEITGLDDDDDLFLETRDREFEEMFEDDDDSNDENNWRNDYPDEDEWLSGDEFKPHRMTHLHEDFGFDIDDELKYDKQSFGEELSSEDELNDYGQPYSLSSRKEVYHDELIDDPDLDGL